MTRKRKQTAIDLQALAAPKRNWTEPELEILYEFYGIARPETIQKRLLTATGIPRTVNAINIHAGSLGLDGRTAQGYLTIVDAARELGVNPHLLYHRSDSRRLKTIGRGKYRFLDEPTMAKLRAEFPPAPTRSMSKTRARKALGYSETHFTRLLIAGAIRGVKRGERWFVDADHIQELVREFRREGITRREWGDLPYLQAERARARNYNHRRMQERRIARQTVWYTQSEARRVLGVGRDEMRRLLEQGLVRGKRENALWLAERAHVDELARQKREVSA